VKVAFHSHGVAAALKRECSIGVIVGDLESDSTSTHYMICHSIGSISCHRECGNLVCPAGFDLGQHRNVVLLSVTEGDDKPAKYPAMFRAADLVLVSKIDLASVMEDFDQRRVERAVRELANAAPVVGTQGDQSGTLVRLVA
jgi:hypothetical protein